MSKDETFVVLLDSCWFSSLRVEDSYFNSQKSEGLVGKVWYLLIRRESIGMKHSILNLCTVKNLLNSN